MGKLALVFLLPLFSCLLPTSAKADPQVNILGVTRESQSGAGNVPTSQINLADCLTDDKIGLVLELAEYQPYELQIWAGTACDQVSSRPPSATATCWLLYNEQPTVPVSTAYFSVRELLRGRTEGESGGNGTSANVPECTLISTASAAQVLNTYVMLLDPNNSVVAAATWQATFKLRAPPPPEVVSVGSGDEQLSVNLEPSTLADQAVRSVELYCDPAPNDSNAAANAQVASGGSGAFIPMCSPSAELVPGADASSLQHLRCGSAPVITSAAVTDRLINGVSYNIAAASVDTYGNIGPLSGVACQVPQARGGDVQARACSFNGAARKRDSTALLGLLVVAVALSRRLVDRRRRATVV